MELLLWWLFFWNHHREIPMVPLINIEQHLNNSAYFSSGTSSTSTQVFMNYQIVTVGGKPMCLINGKEDRQCKVWSTPEGKAYVKFGQYCEWNIYGRLINGDGDCGAHNPATQDKLVTQKKQLEQQNKKIEEENKERRRINLSNGY